MAALAHTLVGSVAGFMSVRVMLGLGEGGNFPSAIKSVALWFPKKERAFATSIFNSGSNVGAIFAPMLVPLIVGLWGWKSAFVITGLAGFVWLFFWIPFYDSPDKCQRLGEAEREFIHSDLDEKAGDAGPKPSWGSLLGYRATWGLYFCQIHDRSGLVVLPNLACRIFSKRPTDLISRIAGCTCASFTPSSQC